MESINTHGSCCPEFFTGLHRTLCLGEGLLFCHYRLRREQLFLAQICSVWLCILGMFCYAARITGIVVDILFCLSEKISCFLDFSSSTTRMLPLDTLTSMRVRCGLDWANHNPMLPLLRWLDQEMPRDLTKDSLGPFLHTGLELEEKTLFPIRLASSLWPCSHSTEKAFMQ